MLTQNEQLLDRKPFYFRGFNSIGLCSRHYYFKFPGFDSLKSPEIRSLDLLTYRVIGTREKRKEGRNEGGIIYMVENPNPGMGSTRRKGSCFPHNLCL